MRVQARFTAILQFRSTLQYCIPGVLTICIWIFWELDRSRQHEADWWIGLPFIPAGWLLILLLARRRWRRYLELQQIVAPPWEVTKTRWLRTIVSTVRFSPAPMNPFSHPAQGRYRSSSYLMRIALHRTIADISAKPKATQTIDLLCSPANQYPRAALKQRNELVHPLPQAAGLLSACRNFIPSS